MRLDYIGSHTFFYRANGFNVGLSVTVQLITPQGTVKTITAIEQTPGVYRWSSSFNDDGKYAITVFENGVPKLFDVVEYVYGHGKTTFLIG